MGNFDLQTSRLRCHLLKEDFIILLFETFSERCHKMTDFEVLMTFVNSDQSSWGRNPYLLLITKISGDGQTAQLETAICWSAGDFWTKLLKAKRLLLGDFTGEFYYPHKGDDLCDRWMPLWCRGSSYQNDQWLSSIQQWAGEKLWNKDWAVASRFCRSWNLPLKFLLTSTNRSKPRLSFFCAENSSFLLKNFHFGNSFFVLKTKRKRNKNHIILKNNFLQTKS